jgi:hypothetical protein
VATAAEDRLKHKRAGHGMASTLDRTFINPNSSGRRSENLEPYVEGLCQPFTTTSNPRRDANGSGSNSTARAPARK